MTTSPSPERAAFFIDGNNFYFSMKREGVAEIHRLDYAKVCDKLSQARQVVYMGYYVGKLSPDAPHYGRQRAFFHKLRQQGIHIVEGRIEKRPAKGDLGKKVNELLSWLTRNIKPKLNLPLYNILRDKVAGLVGSYVWVEKAVDVHLAVDLLAQAMNDEYDVAYILSADGDYTPAVEQAKQLGKRVFAMSLSHGHELSQAVDVYIKLSAGWFDDCLV